MRIYLASNNAHKHAEFSSLFPMHTILLPKDEGIDFFSPEDGSTFFANARQKADALYDVVHAPVLADDSGLCVDALDGDPGVHSARFGAQHGVHTDTARMQLLLERMHGRQDRACSFVCVAVLKLGSVPLCVGRGVCRGVLTTEMSGVEGFGYDPIFLLPHLGRTFAQLSIEEKNRVSHRALAALRIAQVLAMMQLPRALRYELKLLRGARRMTRGGVLRPGAPCAQRKGQTAQTARRHKFYARARRCARRIHRA